MFLVAKHFEGKIFMKGIWLVMWVFKMDLGGDENCMVTENILTMDLWAVFVCII